MFKAMVKVNDTTTTKLFDHMGEAMEWVRSFAGKATSWKVFKANGELYYAF